MQFASIVTYLWHLVENGLFWKIRKTCLLLTQFFHSLGQWVDFNNAIEVGYIPRYENTDTNGKHLPSVSGRWIPINRDLNSSALVNWGWMLDTMKPSTVPSLPFVGHTFEISQSSILCHSINIVCSDQTNLAWYTTFADRIIWIRKMALVSYKFHFKNSISFWEFKTWLSILKSGSCDWT